MIGEPLPPLQARIVDLAKAGAQPRAIAEQCGCKLGTVNVVLSRARRLGIDIPYATKRGEAQANGMRRAAAEKREARLRALAVRDAEIAAAMRSGEIVVLSRRMQRQLTPAAAARGATPVLIAVRILETVLDERMEDVVLDDGVTTPPRAP